MAEWKITGLLFFVFQLSLQLVAARKKPSHTLSFFQKTPERLFFFENTTNAIYLESTESTFSKTNFYISHDRGGTWELANWDLSNTVAMFVEHPFDARQAFLLTGSTTHHRTEDGGNTWQTFETPSRTKFSPKPLSFSSNNTRYVLFQGSKCENEWGYSCHGQTYYTKDSFKNGSELLFRDSSRCQFAHSSLTFQPEVHEDLIYCVGFDTTSQNVDHSVSSSLLFSSTDFFVTERKFEDLGIGKGARGIASFDIISKFAVVSLEDVTPYASGEISLLVSRDGKSWTKAQFPYNPPIDLRKNGFEISESTGGALAVNVHTGDFTDTLYISDSNGTFFVSALQNLNLRRTNSWDMGVPDYGSVAGVKAIGLANVVANADEVEGRRASAKLKTLVTYNGGHTWTTLKAAGIDGRSTDCDASGTNACALHLHRNAPSLNEQAFGKLLVSSPGLIMGVGSIGPHLAPYEDGDLFLSSDAGLSWKMVKNGAHLHASGNLGNVMVVIDDERPTDHLSYSTDMGNSWNTYRLDIQLRAHSLFHVPGFTSREFILLGTLERRSDHPLRTVLVHLDFPEVYTRECRADDTVEWHAHGRESECLMGRKQWYARRASGEQCYVGEDPEGSWSGGGDDCECTSDDFECDFNYARVGDKCVSTAEEPIPAGFCTGAAGQTYLGSSGWRKIPGDSCKGGIQKDAKVVKKCSTTIGGHVSQQIFQFPAPVNQRIHLPGSQTILAQLTDKTIWQSRNDGYAWERIKVPGNDTDEEVDSDDFLAIHLHPYSVERAYLLTSSNRMYITTDSGLTWSKTDTPLPPNSFGLRVLQFQPTPDFLIWSGDADCQNSGGAGCHAEAWYSQDNGEKWDLVERYVRECRWGLAFKPKADPTEIICESFTAKHGSQPKMLSWESTLGLVAGKQFYTEKRMLLNEIIVFDVFSEFLFVGEMTGSIQVSNNQDPSNFAPAMLPPDVASSFAVDVLDSFTHSLFLTSAEHFSGRPKTKIFKSNSNGTNFVLAADDVNVILGSHVDFQKVAGLEGIAFMNIVGDGWSKSLQTRITRNDGGEWKTLKPPLEDSLGNRYLCDPPACSLHLHGYTNPKMVKPYSRPYAVGLMMGVGNVGLELADYHRSDTFLSRDAGFTWEAVHTDPYLWEIGDSGAIIIMARSDSPTDHVLYSTDEGRSWNSSYFSRERIHVKDIMTDPSGTTRRFVVFGSYLSQPYDVAIYIDFAGLTSRECVLDEDLAENDIELWSPSESEGDEKCLFGRQTQYFRRRRNANCIVGNRTMPEPRILKNCTCTKEDFECEFGHVRDENDECALAPGAASLEDDSAGQCDHGEDSWYGRTAYRKISYSSCEGGDRPDRGPPHPCPAAPDEQEDDGENEPEGRRHSVLFWWTVFLIPVVFCVGVYGIWYYCFSGRVEGRIQLFDDSDDGLVVKLASIPSFLLGLVRGTYEGMVPSRNRGPIRLPTNNTEVPATYSNSSYPRSENVWGA
ncbi:vacuolar protein sorting/targeting protein PEP1 [Stygiomarasmius scandens]|uniref:Vacuolar protein sorting/targeting protein PEP1 n=1 Tax=Marasmiellus scandens TaxID=2682957 RepID=A0ABR1IW61_9AGAR